MGAHASRSKVVEQRAIEFIPPSERHGRPNTLFTIWFASNAQITAVATGLLATVVFGLSLPWAIAAILIGNLAGCLFMAYHSVQGPRLGMPQMIQSRAQFGMFGAALPILAVVLLYIGFFTSSAILGGEALARLLHVSTDWGIVICDAITLIMAWIGYDLIHRYDRWASVLFAAVFLAITVKMLTVARPAYHGHADTAASILLAISVFVSWQITWAPYVSDYSRYLPQQTPSSRTFWYTYAGSAIGAIWFMIIGAYGGILAPAAISANTAGYFAGLFPSVQWLILLTAVLGIFAANVENLYGPFLAGAAAVSPSGRVGSAPGPVRGRGRGGHPGHAAGHPGQPALPHRPVGLRAVPALLHDPVDGDQPHRLLRRAARPLRHRGHLPDRRPVWPGQLVGRGHLRGDDRD
jgi:nucleobase:cation symporter-1, NCS1 family